jgi:hypothetical protein
VRTTDASPDAPSGYATLASESSFGGTTALDAAFGAGVPAGGSGAADRDGGVGDDDDGAEVEPAGEEAAPGSGWSARADDTPSHATPIRLARLGAIRRVRIASIRSYGFTNLSVMRSLSPIAMYLSLS